MNLIERRVMLCGLGTVALACASPQSARSQDPSPGQLGSEAVEGSGTGERAVFTEAEPGTVGRWYGTLVVGKRPKPETWADAAPLGEAGPDRGGSIVIDLPAGDSRRAATDELVAWDRKDPAPDPAQVEFDAGHLVEWKQHWRELECLQLVLASAGNRYLVGQGTSEWPEFRKRLEQKGQVWEDRVLEMDSPMFRKSKLATRLLDSEELLTIGYADAYESRNTRMLDWADIRWSLFAGLMEQDVEAVGGVLDLFDGRAGSDLDWCRGFLDAL